MVLKSSLSSVVLEIKTNLFNFYLATFVSCHILTWNLKIALAELFLDLFMEHSFYFRKMLLILIHTTDPSGVKKF